MDESKTPTEDTLHWLRELLRELALEKKGARDRQTVSASKKEKFWKWLKENGSSLTVIVTSLSVLFGALWTANQYINQRRDQVQQEQKNAQLHKETLIAQFAGDLSDKNKRNGAALAIAVLAKDEALPILESHLRDTVLDNEDDKRFRTSLVHAFTSIGLPSLNRLIAVNREVNKSFESFKQQEGVHDVTQRVITYFLHNNPEYFIQNNISLSGVAFRNADFVINADNMNLSNVRFFDSAMCMGSFKKADLRGAEFIGQIVLGGSNMEEAMMDGTKFGNASTMLTLANLSRVRGDKVDFGSSHLDSAIVKDAVLTNASFHRAEMEDTDFSNSNLSGSDFTQAGLYKARFINADLSGAIMLGTDLENVDFSGANLKDVRFYNPSFESGATPASGVPFAGAFVRGTNFFNAKNINDETRKYLCAWGALNVPGGCDGITGQVITFKRSESGFGKASCW